MECGAGSPQAGLQMFACSQPESQTVNPSHRQGQACSECGRGCLLSTGVCALPDQMPTFSQDLRGLRVAVVPTVAAPCLRCSSVLLVY